jgi:hypothetical protein
VRDGRNEVVKSVWFDVVWIGRVEDNIFGGDLVEVALGDKRKESEVNQTREPRKGDAET